MHILKVVSKNNLRIANTVFLFILISASSVVSSNDTTLSLESSSDDSGGSDYYASYSTLADETHEFFIMYGEQKADSNSDIKNTDTTMVNIGIDDLSDTLINTGASVEYWGNNKSLTTRTVQGKFALILDSIRLSLSPFVRKIRLINNNGGEFGVGSDGFALAIAYQNDNGFYFNVNRTEQYYDNNIEFIAQIAQYLRRIVDSRDLGTIIEISKRINFSESSRTIGAGLDDYQNTLIIGHDGDWADFSLTLSKSQQHYGDKVTTKQLGFSVSKSITDTISIEAQTGTQKSPGYSNVKYLGFGITVNI